MGESRKRDRDRQEAGNRIDRNPQDFSESCKLVLGDLSVINQCELGRHEWIFTKGFHYSLHMLLC